MIKRVITLCVLCLLLMSFMGCSKSEEKTSLENTNKEITNATENEKDEEVVGEGECLLFTEEEIGDIDPDDEKNQGSINGVKINKEVSEKMQKEFTSKVKEQKIPEGYPIEQVPIMSNGVIINAEPYAEKGYTVVYQIDKSLKDVHEFYKKWIKDEPSSEDENGIYFENVALDNNIRLAGLTLEIVDEGKTNVYIVVFTK